jgi:predicted transcriptional regulator
MTYAHDTDEARERLHAARVSLAAATEHAADIARQYAGTVSEAKLADDLGVTRMTVRKWLGK